jgi:hypothetical protein
VSGRGALIRTAQRLGGSQKRDAPVAEQLWTHGAAGPKGRYAPFVPYFWGIWNFSKNQAAARPDVLSQLVGREVVEGERRLRSAVVRPATFKTWAEGRLPRARSTTTRNHIPHCRSPARRLHKIGEQI